MQQLVIIGGDAAGMSAASQVRRMQPELGITVFERGSYTSYAACGIPYYVAGLVEDKGRLIARTPETFRKKFRINTLMHHEVLAIYPDKQRILVRDLDTGRDLSEPYDQLLIATGAQAVTTGFDGEQCDNVHQVSTLVHAEAMARALAGETIRKVVIVGGGYIGIEMAEALHLRGLEVSMVHRGPQVMATMDPDMGSFISEALRQSGIKLHLETALEGFVQEKGKVTGVLTSQGVFPADMVILGLGVRPTSRLAREAGIALGPKDSIRVNELQQTEQENIWAAGDCAQSFHLVSRRPVHIALGTVANRQGRVAGINLGGGYATFPGVVGTSIVKFMDTECSRTGLSERELKRLGWHYVQAVIEDHTMPRYYPGSSVMHVKVLAEKGSGKLLGVQIVGGPGAAKRIDTAAIALHAGMDLDTFINVDLSYAPPFSGVWDPIVTAAKQAIKEV
ncbi:MAG: FAD-dependent oxidoreductase [Desulfobulbaceae bacterium]|nr:FAD-dependent oxidoreductase [Desulfobulbaceae bacterium]